MLHDVQLAHLILQTHLLHLTDLSVQTSILTKITEVEVNCMVSVSNVYFANTSNLQELTFYATPTVVKYRNDLIEIILAAGGHLDKQKSFQKALALAYSSPDSYLILSCPEDDYLTKNLKSKNDCKELGITSVLKLNI